MKFGAFKEFRKEAQGENGVEGYLDADLTKIIRELSIGLTRLSLQDNFDSFTVTVTIPATTELAIRNQLVGRLPAYKLILRGGDNTHLVVDGETAWNLNYVYLKNNHVDPLTVTVVFFR